MKQVSEVAPLALQYCITFLKERNQCGSLHPEANKYILDVKTMARIVKHHGNLRAQVSQTEIGFYTHIIQYLKNREKIQSIIDKDSYFICKGNGRGSIEVTQFGRNRTRGRKPLFVRNKDGSRTEA